MQALFLDFRNLGIGPWGRKRASNGKGAKAALRARSTQGGVTSLQLRQWKTVPAGVTTTFSVTENQIAQNQNVSFTSINLLIFKILLKARGN